MGSACTRENKVECTIVDRNRVNILSKDMVLISENEGIDELQDEVQQNPQIFLIQGNRQQPLQRGNTHTTVANLSHNNWGA